MAAPVPSTPWGPVEWGAIAQGFSGIASLVVITVSLIETRRMRQVAVDQMAFMREQQKLLAAEKLMSEEPLIRLDDVQSVGRGRTSAALRNFGAKVFDVVLLNEDSGREVALAPALDSGEAFGIRHLMPAKKERRRTFYAMRFQTRLGTVRCHRFAVGWADGTCALWPLSEGPLPEAIRRRLGD
jgi:hypothetical protein